MKTVKKSHIGVGLFVSLGLFSSSAISCMSGPDAAGGVDETQAALIGVPAETEFPIVLTGSSLFSTIPTATWSTTLATFVVTNASFATFQGLAAQPGVKAVPGDFNGDGHADLALVGGSGWTTVPVAFGTSTAGTYTLSNVAFAGLGAFPTFASQAGVKAVAGDFDGDGKSDIALTGGSLWNTIPFARSNGDGTFTLNSGKTLASFPGLATVAGVKAVAGDFNGDGKADIALVGGSGWGNIPLALGDGTGGFSFFNPVVASFPGWASAAGAQAVSGDFDGDGCSDIALTGGNWSTIPVALSVKATHNFTVFNQMVSNFPSWAFEAGAQAVAGDFNKDGKADIALTGVSGWGSVPIAFSADTTGDFAVLNSPLGSFPTWAAFAGAKAIGAY
jgi:hypothetical protein